MGPRACLNAAARRKNSQPLLGIDDNRRRNKKISVADYGCCTT